MPLPIQLLANMPTLEAAALMEEGVASTATDWLIPCPVFMHGMFCECRIHGVALVRALLCSLRWWIRVLPV